MTRHFPLVTFRSQASSLQVMVTATWLASACGGSIDRVGNQGGIDIRDSLGTIVVSYTNAAVVSLPEWGLEEPAALTLGSAFGDSSEAFNRVVDAEMLDDGTLVIADGGNRHLKVFGADGDYLETVGRRGDGPGEYQVINHIAISGDRIVVLDSRAPRITTLDREFRVVATEPVHSASSGRVAEIHGLLADGSAVIKESVQLPPSVNGQYQVTNPVWRMAAPDEWVSFGGLKRPPTYYVRTERSVSFSAVPFHAMGQIAVLDECVIGATGEAHEIVIRSPDGRVSTITRWQGAHRQVSGDDLDHYLNQQLLGKPGPAQLRYREIFSKMTFPEHWPAITGLLADREGLVWIHEGATPTDTSNTQWLVANAAGRLIARLQVDSDYEPLGVGAGHLIALSKSEDDVDFVSVFQLRRE